MLNSKEIELLKVVVSEYISRAIPVGSKFLLKKYRLGCSPVIKSSSSSGRIPTDLGYRFYVSHLCRKEKSGRTEIEETLKSAVSFDDFLEKVSHMLSEVSDFCGFGMWVEEENISLIKVEFLSLGGREVMLILATESGAVYSKRFHLDLEIPVEELNSLNEIMRNMGRFSLSRLVKKVQELTEAASDKRKRLLGMVCGYLMSLSLAGLIRMHISRSRGFLEGDRRIWPLWDLLDNRNLFASELSRYMITPGYQILLGRENPFPRLNDFVLLSFSSNKFRGGHSVVGAIGFKRMEYGKVLGCLEEIAGSLTRFKEGY